MMSLPPTKKTAPKKGDELISRAVIHEGIIRISSDLPKLGLPETARRVSVDQAAAYAQVGRTKMWELIHHEVNAVVNGHRPGSNRRWVDLDSIDELYRSSERQHEAEEKIRRLREKIAAKNEREDGSG
jgi:hypothetical protein